MKQLVKLHAVTNVHNAARGEAEGTSYIIMFSMSRIAFAFGSVATEVTASGYLTDLNEKAG